MTSARAKFVVRNRRGLHARAAAKLTQVASEYPCEVVIARDGQSANGKSVMGVLLLCGAQGTTLEVAARGEQADEAVAAIGRLFEDRFGEED